MNTDNAIIPISENLDNRGITFESPINYALENNITFGIPIINPIIENHMTSHNNVKQSIFKPLPNTGKGPVGNYYAEINWDNGFECWALVRFSTPMDGSCLFHAIANSFFPPYHEEILHNKHIKRATIISTLRKELSQNLALKISNEPNAPTHYDILNGGNTAAFSEAVPEFKLSFMQGQLNSFTPIGYGYMEFIGNALNKDIYILEALRHDIYVTDELPFTIKGNRNSIILYYMNGHYELVGLQTEDGSFDTHFSYNHTLIKFLRNRVRQFVISK